MLLLSFSFRAFSKEELVVVQIVSKDRKSFVLQKGIRDGYAKGQEVIFSNENASIVCKAIEVNRDYSLWIPIDRNLNIPFNKQDIISYNTHTFGNIGVNVAGEIVKLIPDDKYNKEYSYLRNENNWMFRYSYGMALSQSASSVASESYSKKQGQDFSLEYAWRYSPNLEFDFGGRYDYETYRLSSPELDIPTKRTLITFGSTYHFLSLFSSKNNLYATVTIGFGKSNTTVNNFDNSGSAFILPQVRLGYLVPISKDMALIAEISVESVSAKEKAEDGTTQNSSQVNSKASIGIRF